MRRALRVSGDKEQPWEQAVVYTEENEFKKAQEQSTHQPQTLKFQFKATQLCSIQQAMNCRHLHFCGTFHARASKPFSNTNLFSLITSLRVGNGIAGSLPSLPQGQPLGRWKAEGRWQRLFNSHLTRHLDSSEE